MTRRRRHRRRLCTSEPIWSDQRSESLIHVFDETAVRENARPCHIRGRVEPSARSNHVLTLISALTLKERGEGEGRGGERGWKDKNQSLESIHSIPAPSMGSLLTWWHTHINEKRGLWWTIGGVHRPFCSHQTSWLAKTYDHRGQKVAKCDPQGRSLCVCVFVVNMLIKNINGHKSFWTNKHVKMGQREEQVIASWTRMCGNSSLQLTAC